MLSINPHIFRAYDIRGIVESSDQNAPDLTPESMKLIGQGIGTYLKQNYDVNDMMVGRDNRTHSPELHQAFIQGVLSTGVNVIDIGLATSPLLYYGVCKFQVDSGVNITASHNPKEYNGVKVVRHNAHSVCGDELQSILKLIQTQDFLTGQGKLTTKTDVFTTYLQDITSRIQLSRPLKIVVDAGNGTAGAFAPELFRALGCDVTELYCELDGTYPNHEANPEEAANMRDLGELVVKQQADLGIGFDGDGDRVGVVDETGKHYSADYLIILLARDLLKKHPDSQIVFDVKVSKLLINEIEQNQGQPIMCKTGHSFIEAKMHELNAALAGEISGHLFFGKPYYDYYGFDDAFFGACKILQILAEHNKSFSHHFTNLPKLFTTPEYKVSCPDDKKQDVVKNLTAHFTKNYDCITIDGVRINFDQDSWGAVRCSNTSPNITLRFEAKTQDQLQRMKQAIFEQLKKYPEVSQGWYNQTP